MAHWPNDGVRFNVMHLTDGSSMQVMEESLQADLSQPDFTRQHPQGQGFSSLTTELYFLCYGNHYGRLTVT